MITNKEISSIWGGPRVAPYEDKNIDPLLPLLQVEFSNWSLKKIQSYMNLVTGNTNDSSGVLAAQNEASYNVGIAIYTLQQIGAQFLNMEENINKEENKNKDDKVYNILVIENIIASSPILQKPVFMALVQGAVKIAEYFECDYLELPNINDDKSFEFVEKKYGSYVKKGDNFRSYIDLSNDSYNRQVYAKNS